MSDRLIPGATFLYAASPKVKVSIHNIDSVCVAEGDEEDYRNHLFYKELLFNRNSECLNIRRQAAKEIGQVGGLPIELKEALFLPLLFDPIEDVRVAAVNAIPSFSVFTNPKIIGELQKRLIQMAFQDKSAYVRLTAANVVYKHFYSEPEVQEELLSELFGISEE